MACVKSDREKLLGKQRMLVETADGIPFVIQDADQLLTSGQEIHGAGVVGGVGTADSVLENIELVLFGIFHIGRRAEDKRGSGGDLGFQIVGIQEG
ncbi:MAG: hypothetical protein BWY31_04393 [Lentisphaerae bacterium ADurb.Bin242]|nr:MAG: hypothetical protein BWY31_04393 [Lentisphaerae bacterium ADurb.Bin242]